MLSMRALLPVLGRWPRRVAALGCLLLAVVSAVAARGHQSGPREQRTPVVVSSHDLPAGRVLVAADLQLARWPPALVPRGATSDERALIGHRLAGPLTRHEAVLPSRVLGPGLTAGLGADEVAVPVRVSDPAGAALLRPGERVDLIAAAPGSATAAPQRATTVARRALVLAVLPSTKPENDAANTGTTALIVAVNRESAGEFATLNGSSVLAVVGKSP
jgi:Flp pilus assembly protein CpaB